jgi:hypothetical protein
MRLTMVVGLMIVAFVTTAWSQEKFEAPQLNIGDKWKYRDSGGKEWSQGVIGIDNDVYIIKYGQDTRGYDKVTMNFIFEMVASKRAKYTESRSQILNFPLTIGKKWDRTFTSTPKSGRSRQTEKTYREEYFVSSFEDIKVAAGTFKSVRIEYRSSDMTKSQETAKGTYWYSPDVKTIVKRTEEVSLYTPGMELISFELK